MSLLLPACSAYLLASGGVNADQLSSNINTVNLAGTFEPLVPLSDTDVEVRRSSPLPSPLLLPARAPQLTCCPSLQGYVRHTHEQAIISAIEEGRRATTADFYRSLDTKMRREWERQKEKMFEELGRHQAQAGPSNESSRRQGGQSGFERSVRLAFFHTPLLAALARRSSLTLLLSPTGTGAASSLGIRVAPDALQDAALRPRHPPPQRVPQGGLCVRSCVGAWRGERRVFLERLSASSSLSVVVSFPRA